MFIFMAILYEDYIKLRDAKIGDTVTLADGSAVEKDKIAAGESYIGGHGYSRPSKHMNVDFYDGTYV